MREGYISFGHHSSVEQRLPETYLGAYPAAFRCACSLRYRQGEVSGFGPLPVDCY